MAATNGQLTPDLLKDIYEKGAAAHPAYDRPDGGKAVALPEGYALHDIEPLEKPLPRIRQSTSFHDTVSFIAYLNRFKGENTRLFATPGHLASDRRAVISAILDYHGPEHPDYGAHTARYLPRHSDQWLRWASINGKILGQQEFAEFIEENRRDIVKPAAANLLDIVSRFRASKKVEFNAVVYQPNGDASIGWDETTEYKGKTGVTVPAELSMALPVFFNATKADELNAFMRYRVNDGKVTFIVKLDNPGAVEETAFTEIVETIARDTEIEIYLGVAS